MITMTGNLITLESLDVEKHARGYFAVSQDENIHKYTGNSVPQNVDEIVLLLKKYENYFFNWMITSNDTHEVIGVIRLGKPEIVNGMLVAGESQFLSSKYWRKGHMKEAKKLFYQYVFDVLAVDVLYADVWEGNINSMRSLEFYGYRRVDTTDAIFSKTGELKKKFIYALSRDSYHRHIDNTRLGQ